MGLNFFDVKSIEIYGFPKNEYIYWWIYLLGKYAKKMGFIKDNVYDIHTPLKHKDSRRESTVIDGEKDEVL